VLDPNERDEHDQFIRAARAQLDEAIFNAAWAAGRALTLALVVEQLMDTKNSVRK
jgi:hypothetical protein